MKIRHLTDGKTESMTGLRYDQILGLNNYLWIPAFEFAVSQFNGDIKGSRVLEVGAGMGGLSLYFAKRGCKVVCSDCNTDYVLAAKNKNNVLHVFPGEIEYQTVDIIDNDLRSESVDIICFKSVLGAISPDKQAHAISEMRRILKKKGILSFCENLQGNYLSTLYRKLFVAWYGRWNYLTISKMYQYALLFPECRINSFWFSAPLLARFAQTAAWLGIAIDRSLFAHLGNEYRYIMGGYAIK